MIVRSVVGIQRVKDKDRFLIQENRHIYIEVRTDKDVYNQGEIVKVINLTVHNNRNEDLTLYSLSGHSKNNKAILWAIQSISYKTATKTFPKIYSWFNNSK